MNCFFQFIALPIFLLCNVAWTALNNTPLHDAIKFDDVKAVERLLGAMDINSKDDVGKTSLHYAAQYNSVAIAQWLTEHGANVNAEDIDGYTPLHYASVRFDGAKMAALLVERGANILASDNVHGLTPFELANYYKNKEVFQ